MAQTRNKTVDRIARFFTALFVGTSEMVLAVVLVLAFALVFTALLLVVFPEGSGLVYFYEDFVDPSAKQVRLRIHGLDGQDEGLDSPIVAVLSRVHRQVRDRPVRAVAWKRARQGMDLEDRHTIQTLERSTASIRFEESNELKLGEKSLVVVKRSGRGGRERNRRASVVLLGGKLRGRLLQTSRAPDPMEVVTGAGSSRFHSREGEQAEFTIAVNPDQSSTFTVYSGAAEVTSEGRTARVDANQSLTVIPDQPPGEPERLPDPPELDYPVEGHVEMRGSTSPMIRFGWEASGDADSYQISVARDPEFADVVHTDVTGDTDFTHGNLEAGRYYWRVSPFRGRAEGRSSPVRSFEVVRDLEPPDLELSLPEVVETDRLVIGGRTEPGTRIYIGDAAVPVGPDGEFERVVILERGINMIVVEAVDEAGNSAYHSQYVNARFQATE